MNPDSNLLNWGSNRSVPDPTLDARCRNLHAQRVCMLLDFLVDGMGRDPLPSFEGISAALQRSNGSDTTVALPVNQRVLDLINDNRIAAYLRRGLAST